MTELAIESRKRSDAGRAAAVHAVREEIAAGNVVDDRRRLVAIAGVAVEAASPALIEKVRSVVTDDTGHYRVVDLRPAACSVTFTLPGFSTVRCEGIELTGTFARPWGIGVSPDGDKLFTANGPSGDMSIVDTASGKVERRVAVGGSPWGVVVVEGAR